ncbi:MAG: sigma-70 family RNA polymerase sigma factor [Methylobacteriaceae bacterium]|nr:sigma-70 family RNA polymerase sigma factor [Methylobacteriaceae bacterium]
MNQTIDTDRRLSQLMRAAQGGNGVAYAALLREAAQLVRQAAQRRRSFLQPQDIEDLVQNTLLALHSVRATYDPARPFLPWLMAIARNQFAEGVRRHARRHAREVAVECLPERSDPAAANADVDNRRDADLLIKSIRMLPPGQRHAIEMLKLREMSLREASAVSGTSIAALKVAVHRGLKTLRELLRASA